MSYVICLHMLVQVVHLVRDPRAMITSITKRSGVWSDALKNSTYQCKRMLDDMKIEEGLPEERCKNNVILSGHIYSTPGTSG